MTSSDPAALHEVRTDWRSGQPLGRVFRAASGSIEARACTRGAVLRRLFGPSSDDLALPWEDLDVVARAFTRWATVRDDWASYHARPVAPYSLALRLYVPPGKHAQERVLGSSHDGWNMRVFHFSGTEEVRPLTPPRACGDGVQVIADLWRLEPRVGPLDGERVGERWALERGLALDVRRPTATLYVPGGRFPWRAHEWDFPAQVLGLRRHLS